jgi:hypothetical protein
MVSSGFADMKGGDLAAFVASNILGFLAGMLLPKGPWSIYVTLLISYHLFLAWLLITADQETGLSLHPVSTLATHCACLAIILTYGMGRHYIPFEGILRYGIVSLAVFERSWLFSGGRRKAAPAPVAVAAPVIESSPDDYQEWLRLLGQRKSSSNRTGVSLKTEYEQWLAARAQIRRGAPSDENPV